MGTLSERWIVAGALFAAPCMAQDVREPAMRTEAERTFILGQMRLFLQSTHAIAVALGKNDLRTVEDGAWARGRTRPA